VAAESGRAADIESASVNEQTWRVMHY